MKTPCGKVGHATEGEANEAIDNMRKYNNRISPAAKARLNAYKCGKCGCYHVGKRPPWMRARKRRGAA